MDYSIAFHERRRGMSDVIFSYHMVGTQRISFDTTTSRQTVLILNSLSQSSLAEYLKLSNVVIHVLHKFTLSITFF